MGPNSETALAGEKSLEKVEKKAHFTKHLGSFSPLSSSRLPRHQNNNKRGLVETYSSTRKSGENIYY
jgi:hypothetical protein